MYLHIMKVPFWKRPAKNMDMIGAVWMLALATLRYDCYSENFYKVQRYDYMVQQI